MFDIGWTEILVVAVVAILVVGPKELPSMLMTFGRTVGRMRRMANEFQSQFNDVLREAERQADVGDIRKELAAVTSLDPTKKASTKVEAKAEPVKSGAVNGSGSIGSGDVASADGPNGAAVPAADAAATEPSPAAAASTPPAVTPDVMPPQAVPSDAETALPVTEPRQSDTAESEPRS
ncbi:Sec-independent protein translocase protein TatB [Amorphus sp. MBR-141]